jgi:hypothetical protein
VTPPRAVDARFHDEVIGLRPQRPHGRHRRQRAVRGPARADVRQRHHRPARPVEHRPLPLPRLGLERPLRRLGGRRRDHRRADARRSRPRTQ